METICNYYHLKPTYLTEKKPKIPVAMPRKIIAAAILTLLVLGKPLMP